MSQLVKTLTLESTDTDCVAASQTIAVGAVTINGIKASGGVATLTAAHILTATVTNDQTGATLAVVGKNANGNEISETITLSNGSTTNTTKYYKTVTSLTVAGTVTGSSAIIVGLTSTNGAVSETISTDWHRAYSYKCSLAVTLAGTGTYTVQHTFDDIQDLAVSPIWFNHDQMASLTVNEDGNYDFPIRGIRLRATAASAAITLTVVE